MNFPEQIKRLREERQIPQRKMAAALDIDTATYCKYEKGKRRPKREQYQTKRMNIRERKLLC